MPHSTEPVKVPKKLVLCFDGTGNAFRGSTADTNVVKIYDKLDRHTEQQYHYYQTGIGTYDISGGSINKGPLGWLKSSISCTLDQGFATTFDAHVIAGYRFIMRYYDPGDKIYMFGFSRGAFTARFLARMIDTVGLLSKGNEEMVPFAYQLYQRYEQGKLKVDDYGQSEQKKAPNGVSNATASNENSETDQLLVHGTGQCSDGQIHTSGSHAVDEMQMRRNEIQAFTSTFCRREGSDIIQHSRRPSTGIKVYFLGLFDCVSSVSVLEGPFGRVPPPVPVLGTATHVRHAVALDEKRVKFKAALLTQDIPDSDNKEDIKEVWFPGNHGDVGGGWPAPKPKKKGDVGESSPAPKPGDEKGIWETIKHFFWTDKPKGASQDAKADPYQMSDVALHWMINEVREVGRRAPQNALHWSDRATGFEKNYARFKEEQAYSAPAHDTTKFLGGLSFMKVLLWKFMEHLPFLARWEIDDKGKWYYERVRPNRASPRDIPAGAVFHDSVHYRLQNDPEYRPKNNLGGHTKVAIKGPESLEPKPSEDGDSKSPHHQTFVLRKTP